MLQNTAIPKAKEVMTFQHPFSRTMIRRFLMEGPAQEPVTSRLWVHSSHFQALPVAVSSQDPRITRANLALLGMLSRYLGEVNEEEPITSRLWVPVSVVGSENDRDDASREENEWAEHGIKEENWNEEPEKEENSHKYEDENSHNEEASYDKESTLRKEGTSEEYSEE